LLQQANLVGIGFGVKETEGALTGELAVRIYVERKLPTCELSSRNRIPRLINGITTDVIAVGRPRFHSRPVALGSAISHFQGGAGSVGCIVTRPEDNSWYLLSACHVLAPIDTARTGDAIVEPPATSSGAAPIASLTDFEALKAEDSANRFDAAIARIDRRADILARLPRIGEPRPPIMDPLLYQSVRKFGATTLHTLGVVTDAMVHITFTLDGNPYLFRDVIEVIGCGGPFSEGGDSGALAVDALSLRPVGLIIGGARDRTYLSPIGPILARFNAELLT
jgi:hypothetical protein